MMNLPQTIHDEKFKKLAHDFSNIQEFKDWHSASCLVEVDGEIIFIRRVKTMPTHAGQIGFMAGGKKTGETPIQTALREFEEESSIEFNGTVVGLLPPVMVVSGKVLIPVYMKVDGNKEDFINQIKSNGEWDHLFTIPLAELSQPKRWSFARFHGVRVRKIYFFAVHKYLPCSETMLWGATARIVFDFLKLKDMEN